MAEIVHEFRHGGEHDRDKLWFAWQRGASELSVSTSDSQYGSRDRTMGRSEFLELLAYLQFVAERMPDSKGGEGVAAPDL